MSEVTKEERISFLVGTMRGQMIVMMDQLRGTDYHREGVQIIKYIDTIISDVYFEKVKRYE